MLNKNVVLFTKIREYNHNSYTRALLRHPCWEEEKEKEEEEEK